jgi:hypothetical protein
MAHWAEIDENNIVLRVTVGDNENPDEGYQWLIDNLGGTWVKTSYNTRGNVHLNGGTPFRKNYAGIGYVYDLERDAFIPPKVYPSWTLNEDTCLWDPPVPMPEPSEKELYDWSEEELKWIKTILE